MDPEKSSKSKGHGKSLGSVFMNAGFYPSNPMQSIGILINSDGGVQLTSPPGVAINKEKKSSRSESKNTKGKSKSEAGSSKSKAQHGDESSKVTVSTRDPRPPSPYHADSNDMEELSVQLAEELSLDYGPTQFLQMDFDDFNPNRQMHWFNILTTSQHTQRLTLNFTGVFGDPLPKGDYRKQFKLLSAQLRDFRYLHTFEFKFIVKPTWRSESFEEAILFHTKLFKQIITSSRSLKHIILRSSELGGFLRELENDSIVAGNLRNVITLQLHTEDENDYLEKYMGLVSSFICNVSSSIEVLRVCGVNYKALPSYPHMPNLRVLCIQSPLDFTAMNLSTTSFPILQVLIFRYSEFSKDFSFEFGWPFGEGIVKGVPPPEVNLVVYAKWQFRDWQLYLKRLFEQIVNIKVKSLFVDLTANGEEINVEEACEDNNFLYYGRHSSVERCFVRTLKRFGKPPVVIDILEDDEEKDD